MKKQYRVSFMVNCGGNWFDANDFADRCVSIGLVDYDAIGITGPIRDIDGNLLVDHYTVHISTTSEIKKKLIKYFKLRKDTCLDGSPMRDGYVM